MKCLNCKGKFTPKTWNQKFCSPACRQSYHGGRGASSKRWPFTSRRVIGEHASETAVLPLHAEHNHRGGRGSMHLGE